MKKYKRARKFLFYLSRRAKNILNDEFSVVYNGVEITKYMNTLVPSHFFKPSFESAAKSEVYEKLEQEIFPMDKKILYPVLLIPKTCTVQEVADNMFINLSITSSNNDGHEMCLYSGFCKIKVLDSYDVDIREASVSSAPDTNDIDQIQAVEASHSSCPPYSQSQGWIDPDCSPFVYNNYNTPESQSRYSVYHQPRSSHIAGEQHNANRTRNMYSYPKPIHSPAEEFEHNQFNEIQMDDTNPQNNASELNNRYEDDEFECGVFLSQLSEVIMNEKEARAREELHYIGLESEDDALKQLMSSDIQSMSKQQKTILFLGPDSHFGQTTQKIAINDPSLECIAGGESGHEIVVDNKNRPNQTYKCEKCMQSFDQITVFKQHMVGTHIHKQSKDDEASSSKSEAKFKCFKCGKSLKNQEKFELHCLGHGEPDLECSKCGKVFASKSTMRTHKKIHYRQHRCEYCNKIFASRDELLAHAVKVHFVFACDDCEFTADKYEDLVMHEHYCQAAPRAYSDVSQGLTECANSLPSTFAPSTSASTQQPTPAEIHMADSIIAKIKSNKIFLLHAKNMRKDRRYKKVCDVCSKSFDRIGELKRHLIEHVIRSTLAKNPVNKHGALNIPCDICHEETFNRVDRYKAHLREHAKLTLYQCTSCNKSFSDSSNFCKHKKIHGASYFQCDLCQRKFNSKKMIIQHMEYHNNNSPIQCFYCNKEFHFESMLKKHIKYTHTKEISTQFRCKFCHEYFKTLKEKWDHEWNIHSARKMIVDCRICGSKFRKYSDLKRHCNDIHYRDIPYAKELLKMKVPIKNSL